MSQVLAVIPARFHSTRFPGKVLAPLNVGNSNAGTMLEQVWSRAKNAARVDRLIVATDHDRVRDAAQAFGAEVVMTSPDHVSGTDRVAEVLQKIRGRFDVVINIQGDEPLLTPSSLDRLVAVFDGLRDDPGQTPRMATLSEPLESIDELFDPNAVKVVVADDGRALYFSRSPIPYYRGDAKTLAADFRTQLATDPKQLARYRKHQGIYAYTPETLLELTHREPSTLELSEGLEQLRALQTGYAIHVVESDFRSMSVDTPDDLERVKARMSELQSTEAKG